MSAETFPYDVFLSHSARDKAVVRPLAERLRQDGLKMPFHFGFRHSDFGFAQPGPFRFRDPLNQDRRFIPLRLDDAPIKGSLAQFLYIDWFPANREQENAKLLVDGHRAQRAGQYSEKQEKELIKFRERLSAMMK